MPDIRLNENPRILITRSDRIGDLVLSTPVFSALRRQFPGAHLAALTFTENRQILEGNPSLNEVILYDKKGAQKHFFGSWKLAREIAKMKFDVVIHLHATNRMHLLTWMAGIPVRIGWDRRAAWALTHSFPDIKKEGKKHEAEYNFDLLEPLGVKCPEKMELYFPVPAKAKHVAGNRLTAHGVFSGIPLVVLSPGASCPSKRWPAERFAEVADAINASRPAAFAAVGSSADKPLIEKIQKHAKVKVRDFSGEFDLSALAAFFQLSSLVISNDSGPVHIAAAVGTPVVSIFGRRQPGLSPTRWRPLGPQSSFVWKDVGCDPCLAHECQIHFLCLDAVSVEDVLKKIPANYAKV